jgi:hypothetical protein
LELLLGFLVSTFDGLMRSMLEIANGNRRYFNSHDPAHPLMAQMDLLPASLSFQNLARARHRLLPTSWDMKDSVIDWDALVMLFQKRHTVAHRLGIVDQEYLDKTTDPAAVIGKQVPLTGDSIVQGARECQLLVNGFFGVFLS